MKKIVFAIMTTISGLVLLFSYRTSLGESEDLAAAAISGSDAAQADQTSSIPSASSTPTPSASASSSPAATDATGSASTATEEAAATGLVDGTYTGAAASTRYGAVQVQITVSGGEITDITVPQYPSGDRRDEQISQASLPRLISETLSAQSAEIDMVSGATYTSRGYIQSLQSAIDEAAA